MTDLLNYVGIIQIRWDYIYFWRDFLYNIQYVCYRGPKW